MHTLVIVLVVLFLLGAFGSAPNFGWHTAGWGPSGGLGTVALILLILWLAGVI